MMIGLSESNEPALWLLATIFKLNNRKNITWGEKPNN